MINAVTTGEIIKILSQLPFDIPSPEITKIVGENEQASVVGDYSIEWYSPYGYVEYSKYKGASVETTFLDACIRESLHQEKLHEHKRGATIEDLKHWLQILFADKKAEASKE